MKIENIKKYLKHFSDKEIDLYGEEYCIGERLIEVMTKIKDDDYSYKYTNFPGNDFEISSMLFILEYLGLLEWGTSIRFGWIDHDKRDEFDILLQLLKKDKQIISFKIEYDGYSESYNKTDKEHIRYIQNKLT